MAVRALAVLGKDLGLGLSFCTRLFTTIHNSSSKDLMPSSGLHRHMCTLRHPHIYVITRKKNKEYRLGKKWRKMGLLTQQMVYSLSCPFSQEMAAWSHSVLQASYFLRHFNQWAFEWATEKPKCAIAAMSLWQIHSCYKLISFSEL